MKAYFDSSAIVKLGRPERESLALIDYLDEQQPKALTTVLADVEVRRALDRLRARGADPGDHVRGFFLIDLSRDVRDMAAKVAPELRSLDAVHLATALSIGVDLDFVTYDDRLAVSARAAGLRVVQPGR
ncbi:MAG: type II toxin-antitoxin system VapC family toxin [Acidobacteriota bacterium]|nr:type II toxin-antitoxin system VapC family toxin [Acidobacteriota bacterium]